MLALHDVAVHLLPNKTSYGMKTTQPEIVKDSLIILLVWLHFQTWKMATTKERFKITSYHNKGVICWAVPDKWPSGRSGNRTATQTAMGKERNSWQHCYSSAAPLKCKEQLLIPSIRVSQRSSCNCIPTGLQEADYQLTFFSSEASEQIQRNHWGHKARIQMLENVPDQQHCQLHRFQDGCSTYLFSNNFSEEI